MRPSLTEPRQPLNLCRAVPARIPVNGSGANAGRYSARLGQRPNGWRRHRSPDRYVIINPDQKTPLSISINETTVNDRRIVKHYHSDASSPVIYGGASRLGVGRGARYSARHWHRSH